jgi:hypothetical protein
MSLRVVELAFFEILLNSILKGLFSLSSGCLKLLSTVSGLWLLWFGDEKYSL